MTATDTAPPEPTARAARELIERAQQLSEDFGSEVEEAVRKAAAQPLDEEQARRLYRRVLSLLRSEDSADLDPEERRRLARDIDAEVAALIAAAPAAAGGPAAGTAPPGSGPQLVPRMGLTPHPVQPTPVFNGIPVPMTEGYVDVLTIPLWRDNARVRLYVEEFQDRQGRPPDAAELTRIMLGSGAGGGGRRADADPFKLQGLAQSIARRGVERPPILAPDGVLHDGNRRVAACLLVQGDAKYSAEEKDRARWVKVWMAADGVTADQLDAVVVALNFETDHKIDWPEYVKARLVAEAYDEAVLAEPGGRPRGTRETRIRQEVGNRFAISASDVLRYVRMIRWATDFEEYHIDQGRDQAAVRYRSNDVFQWFYEIDAGKGQAKLTHQLDGDDDLRAMVYDLMFDVLDSGLQVRNLHRVVGQEDALQLLRKAHDSYEQGDAAEALDQVKDAVAEAVRRSPSRRGLAFDKFAEKVIDRFGAAAADDWQRLTDTTRRELRRVLRPALAALQGDAAAGSPAGNQADAAAAGRPGE